MLNGLPEFPAMRIAALAAVSAGLIVGAAAAVAPAGTTNEARGCVMAASVTAEHIHGVELFRPAGCF